MDGDARQLDAVADELYRLPLEEFIPARDARVKELRKADRPLATAIDKLRKPSAAAWVVNLLVHESPELLDQLAELAEALRAAQDSLSGEQLRALSSQRHQVVASVVKESRRLASARGVKVGDAVQRELEATFDAALADPSASRAIRSGRLTTSLSYAGLGEAGAAAGPTTSAGTSRPAPATVPAKSLPRSKDKADADTRAAAAEAAEAERRRAEHEEAVRVAEQALDEAVAARDAADAERARVAAARDEAQQRVDDLQAQLEQAQQDVTAAAGPVREADRTAQKAERSASAAERRWAAAREALAQLER